MPSTPVSTQTESGDRPETADAFERPGTVRALLSGGIGSGKSAVADLLRRRGAHIIDADRIGHDVLEEECRDEVAARWPEAVRDGVVDRGVLAAIVFDDPVELAALEAITHPAIAARIAAEVAGVEASVVVVEMPVLGDLVGPGWLRVVVDACESIRVARLRGRGMEPDDIRARMMAQPTRQAWLAAADLVVKNERSLEDLEAEVDALWQRLTHRPTSA